MRLLKPNVERLLSQRNIAGLIKALGDQDLDVREAATQALVQIGASALDLLVAALRRPDAVTRCRAAWTLGAIGSPLAVEALVAALHDPDFDVRTNAATSLGQIRDPRAVGPLAEAANCFDPLVRKAVRQALQQFDAVAIATRTEELIRALDDPNKTTRSRAARALDALGWKASGTRHEMAYWVARGAGDCEDLFDALAANQIAAAERATRALIHGELPGQAGPLPKTADIQKIPCETLLMIDALWRHFRGGHAGLSTPLPDDPLAVPPAPCEWANTIALDQEGEYEYVDFTLGERRMRAAMVAMRQKVRRCWNQARAGARRQAHGAPGGACPKCGQPLAASAVRCRKCGHRLV